MVNVLFVCMGNICRSPTAEGYFRHIIKEAGLVDQIKTDSAGTHAYHIGSPPDNRAQAAADKRGIDLSSLRGRKVESHDFNNFDYILAMDSSNHSDLEDVAGNDADNLFMFLEFADNFSETGEDIAFSPGSTMSSANRSSIGSNFSNPSEIF